MLATFLFFQGSLTSIAVCGPVTSEPPRPKPGRKVTRRHRGDSVNHVARVPTATDLRYAFRIPANAFQERANPHDPSCPADSDCTFERLRVRVLKVVRTDVGVKSSAVVHIFGPVSIRRPLLERITANATHGISCLSICIRFNSAG